MSLRPADHALIEAFIDDQLSVDELTTLRARLNAEPALAEALAAAITLHGGIHAATVADWDGIEMQTRLELALGPDDRACPFTSEVMQRLDPPVIVTKPAGRRRHWRKVVLAAAPLWLAAILFLAFFIGSAGKGPSVVAEIDEIDAGTMLTRQGTTRELTAADDVRSGDVVTVTADGKLTATLKDGSQITISNAGQLRVDGNDGSNLFLAAGRLRAQVQPRDQATPLVIRTDYATTTVVGTAFDLQTNVDGTELTVSEGIVEFLGSGDELLRLLAGDRALARPGRPPIRIDADVLAAATAPLPPAVRDFRSDDVAALIRFGPQSAPVATTIADAEGWVERLSAAGVQRVLLEIWTDTGVRLWPQAAEPSPVEKSWYAVQKDLPRRLADACEAAGIRFGIACPINHPDAAKWLRDYLSQGSAPCEIHLTDATPVQTATFWQWRQLGRELAPDALVTMAATQGQPPIAANGQPLGRYLRISVPEAEALLMLAEVEVMVNDKNVALGKTTRQSSTDWNGSAGRAVDGNRSGRYPHQSVSHTQLENAPWWEVDLGRSYLLDEIGVWNRTDAHLASFRTYRVQVLDERRQPVWETLWNTRGGHGHSLALTDTGGLQPIREHLAFRNSRYYCRADETELIGGREIFQAAMANLSLGRAPLLVVTPRADGLLPGHEVESLMHYRARWRLSFERPLPAHASLTTSSGEVASAVLGDGMRGGAWEAPEWTPDATLEIELASPQRANAILLREPLDRGSRNPLTTVFYESDSGWQKLAEFRLAGDRLLSFPECDVSRLRIHLNRARYAPSLEEAALLRLPN